MGVPRGTIRLLLDEIKRRKGSGRVLELGRMSIHATDEELAGWARQQGVALRPLAQVTLSHDPQLAAQDCLSAESFFGRLGFDEVDTLDISDWEQPDLIWNLNVPVPTEWHGRYDLVFEAGTLQHVFHLPQALANLHALLKEGGRVVHGQLPSHNHVDHGFYMFCPTLLWDFYTQNGWRIDAAYWAEFEFYWLNGKFCSRPWRIRRYQPGQLDQAAYGGFGWRQVALFFVATKMPGATADKIPDQSWYQRFWAEQAEKKSDATPSGKPSRALRLWKSLRAYALNRLPRRLPKVDLIY